MLRIKRGHVVSEERGRDTSFVKTQRGHPLCEGQRGDTLCERQGEYVSCVTKRGVVLCEGHRWDTPCVKESEGTRRVRKTRKRHVLFEGQ